MLPGTFAYVAAGNYGKEVLLAGGEHSGPASWQMIGVGVLTIVIIYYIGQLAKTAMVELEAEDASSSLSSEVGGGKRGVRHVLGTVIRPRPRGRTSEG